MAAAQMKLHHREKNFFAAMQTIEERILRTLKTSQQLQAVRILGETLQQQDRQAGHYALVI
jgi:hypothetical protein